MELYKFLLWQTLILLKIVHPSFEINYEYVFLDENVFNSCPDPPPGFSDVHKLFDLSELNSEIKPDGLHISGNITIVWDVQPTDRIEGRISVLHLDRGSWQPTILNIWTYDFCKIFNDQKQVWYNSFVKYIVNKNDTEKCFNNKGTVYYVEPYVMNAIFGAGMRPPPGLNRIVFTLSAVDENNVKRPNGICFEITGEFVRQT
ncbi:uncharacterized protein LOC108135468 isoform X1 [Drosophila elegans]|uniref:uncharacterized protein LOC108135468 isoform X1 n=1 Tax=Drosophila elegans TaxID=30023 RepID=UPI0007E69975|nr:uncharacterized protein LOC108135468 isoform X1 [Drosophila elegans]